MGPEPLRQPPAARPVKQPRVGRRAVAEEGDALAQNGTHTHRVAGQSDRPGDTFQRTALLPLVSRILYKSNRSSTSRHIKNNSFK